jgi:hypothetical protein
MANKSRGELKLPGTEYTIRYTINSLCELESAANVSIPELLEKLQNRPTLSVIRTLLWGGLRYHHPNVTLDDAGDLMGEVFTSEDTVKIISEALAASLNPKGKDTEEDAGEKKEQRLATG